MYWVVYSLVFVGLYVIQGLISKKILADEADYDAIAYGAAFNGLIGAVALVIYVVMGIKTSDLTALTQPKIGLLLAANVGLYTLSGSIYYWLLKKIQLSELTLVYASTGVWALMAGSLIGTDSWAVKKVVGGLLVITSVYVVSRLKSGELTKLVKSPIILGPMILALATMTDKAMMGDNYMSLLAYQTLSFGLVPIGLLLTHPKSVSRLRQLASKAIRNQLVVSSLLFFVAYVFLYKAYQTEATASQINFVVATETVVTVIASAIFLGERKNLKVKLVASMVAVVGVILLA